MCTAPSVSPELIVTGLPVPAAEEQPYSLLLPPRLATRYLGDAPCLVYT